MSGQPLRHLAHHLSRQPQPDRRHARRCGGRRWRSSRTARRRTASLDAAGIEQIPGNEVDRHPRSGSASGDVLQSALAKAYVVRVRCRRWSIRARPCAPSSASLAAAAVVAGVGAGLLVHGRSGRRPVPRGPPPTTDSPGVPGRVSLDGAVWYAESVLHDDQKSFRIKAILATTLPSSPTAFSTATTLGR